jgi:hypothetical protein
VKGGDGEEKEDGNAAAALPHAVALVGAPSLYSCGGAKERRRFEGDSAATFLYVVAPERAPSAEVAGLYGDWRGYN